MKSRKILTFLVLALGLMVCWAKVSEAGPMGTGFTYQGRLIDANNPADGEYDFQFKLYASPVDGNQVGKTIDIDGLNVIDGYFTVELDFGDGDPNVFPGDTRWLEIAVVGEECTSHSDCPIGQACLNGICITPCSDNNDCPAGQICHYGNCETPCSDNNDCPAGQICSFGICVTVQSRYTILSPRQKITPTPYSLLSRGIFVDDDRNVGIGTNSPSHKLNVVGDVNITGSLYAGSGSTVLFVDDVNDRVGIGTTEPEASLDIISATGGDGIIVETAISSPNGVVAEFSNDSATPDGILLSVSSGFDTRFKIAADGTAFFAGNVGIGTWGPTRKLEILTPANSGFLVRDSSTNLIDVDTSSNQLALRASEGGDIVLQPGSGNVGIGTYSPAQKLHVNGSAVITGNVGIGTVDPQAGLDVVGNDSNSSIKGTNWDNGTGVYGQSGTGKGVYGESIGGNGNGVHGKGAGNGNGVYGEHLNGNSGYLGGGFGAYGSGPFGSYGYLGGSNTGVHAEGSDFGIFARSSGTAGYFDGSVQVNTNLGVSGTKNFVQPHPVDPDKEIVYVTAEAPEAVVFIRGTAELKDGKAEIELPDYFRVVAAEEGVQVQVTPHSADTFGLAVVRRSHEKIVVKELKNGCGNFEFDYFVTAIRAGFEEHQAVAENTHFRPRADETAEEFEARYSRDDMTTKAIRGMLISNGILTEDSKLNMAKVKELGWEPWRKTTDEKIEKVFVKKP